MLTVAVCDDNPMQTEIIQSLIDKYQAERADVEIHALSFHSGDDLLSCFDAGWRIDLFLLDILMPGKTGIDLARELRERDTDAPLVFLTSSKEHALEAFEVAAVQYIVKPITESKLFPVLDKIIISGKLEERNFFTLPAKGQLFNIPFSSIIYIELTGRSPAVHTTSGKTIIGSAMRISFDSAMAPLLKDERFLQAHKSFVLNMSHVASLDCASFTMKNGSQVPIPRHRYADVKDKFLAYLAKRGTIRGTL